VRGNLAPCTTHAPTRACKYTCSRQNVQEQGQQLHLYSLLHLARSSLEPSRSPTYTIDDEPAAFAACMSPKKTRYMFASPRKHPSMQPPTRTSYQRNNLICTSFLCSVYLLNHQCSSHIMGEQQNNLPRTCIFILPYPFTLSLYIYI
jgi:hypothetical protein